MRPEDITNRRITISNRIEQLYKWRITEDFLKYVQESSNIEVIWAVIEESLKGKPEDKKMGMAVLIKLKVLSNIPITLVERVILAIEEGILENVSIGVRCLIEIIKKIKVPMEIGERIVLSVDKYFKSLNYRLSKSVEQTETRKALLLSSEPVVLVLLLIQIAKEEEYRSIGSLAHTLCDFSLFFVQNPDTLAHYLINENIKLQTITTLTQITSLFMHLHKSTNTEIQSVSGFIPELSIFLLGYCPDDAVSIKKDIYHHLSILKSEKKKVFAGYSEAILKEGILLRPKNAVLKLLGMTLSTEFLIMFRDTTHRHLSLKLCREAARILAQPEPTDHTLNKLCANVLVQINDTTIGDNISIGEKGFFIRMNYIAFLNAFRKYSQIEVTEDTKNVLRSIIRGMKNTMHYFSLFQNIPSNAIVFSLKCFTSLEVTELSLNLGRAFVLFSSFDLEVRSDIIIVCEFLLIFFYLDAQIFQRVLENNVKTLFALTKKNKSMFIIWKQFLAYAGVARKFASVVIQELLENIYDAHAKEFIIQGFRELFASITVHTAEIESIISQNIQQIFKKCLVVDESLFYTIQIVIDLFKAAGKEKLEILHKDMALVLPTFFAKIDKISKIYPERTEYIELCLTIPVKISVLLPFLGQMAGPIIQALKMKNKLSIAAMEVLETCIDNLNSEFLMTYLGDQIDKIFILLIDLVYHEDSSVLAIKLLGKISSKANNAMGHLSIEQKTTAHLVMHIPQYTDPIEVPVDQIFRTASEIIEGKRAGPKDSALQLAGYYFYRFFEWNRLTPEILQHWRADIEKVYKSNFEELHKLVQQSEFYPSEMDLHHTDFLTSTDLCYSFIQALFAGASEGVDLSNTSQVSPGIERITNESSIEESPEEEIDPLEDTHIAYSKRLLNSIYTFLTTVKVLELVNFEEFQRRITTDTTILIDALMLAFGNEKTEKTAKDLLNKMYQTAYRMCGTKEKTSQMTLFYTILHTFCSACYAYKDQVKMCGVKGIIFMTQTLDIGKNWLLFQEIRIIKALFSALVSERYNNIEVIREAIFHIIRTTHDPATEIEPTVSEQFTQLIFAFAQELSHPHNNIREVSRQCLDYSAELFSTDVATFLRPIKEKILVQTLNKPLRALPPGVQIGNMDIISYLFGLRPPLLKIDERIERFIGEAFRIISSPNSTLDLRVSSVKLFVSAAISPEFTSNQFLMKISQVLIKGLFAKESCIVDICKDGLRQMYIQGKEPPKELLQTWLTPIIGTFGQKKISLQIILGLSYFQELDPRIFKPPMLSSLLEMLTQEMPETSIEEYIDVSFRIFARAPILPEGEFITGAVMVYIQFFKNAHTKDLSKGFRLFMESKVSALTMLFRIANEDDSAYYIFLSYIKGLSSIKGLSNLFSLTSQSTWRQYVLINTVGHIFTKPEIEKGLDMWKDSVEDEEFEKLLKKWSLINKNTMLFYYSAEEYRVAPITEPKENVKEALNLFISLIATEEILSQPVNIQKRLIRTFSNLLPDKSVLCIEGPIEWKSTVASVLISDPTPSPEATKVIIPYLKALLEIPEIEPIDAIKIIVYLVEKDPSMLTDSFISLITVHPEYAEYAIKGIVMLLTLYGLDPFIEYIISALEDETLYKIHLYIVLPVVARIPKVFIHSKIEPIICSITQKLFSSSNARISLLLFNTIILWYKEGCISDEIAGILSLLYVTHYVHNPVTDVPISEALASNSPNYINSSANISTHDISSLIELPISTKDKLIINQDKLCVQSVVDIYKRVGSKSPKIAEVLRPAVLACFTNLDKIDETEKLINTAGKIDCHVVKEIFNRISENMQAAKATILCAQYLKDEEVVEKVLQILEESLKVNHMHLSEILSTGLKYILNTTSTETQASTLTTLAQILCRHPEVFKHPETAECAVNIVQSTEVSLTIKQSLLLAMSTEELQEVRFGLVLSAYLDPKTHKEEIASGLQPLFVKGLFNASDKIRMDFFRLFDEFVSLVPEERLLYLCGFEWELSPESSWLPAFTRMLMSLVDITGLVLEPFWKIEGFSTQQLLESTTVSSTLPMLTESLQKYSLSKETIKGHFLSLLYHTDQGTSQALKALLPTIISPLSDKSKSTIHTRLEEMLIRLGMFKMHNISFLAESIILSTRTLCRNRPTECKILEVANHTGSWTSALLVLEGKKESCTVYSELKETGYFLAQLRIQALYPETIKALTYQQLGMIKTAQTEYEDIQAKAQSGALLFNEDEYKVWEEQWIECASYLQQWDLLAEIGTATKNLSLTAKAKWYTTNFSIESDKAAFKVLIDPLPTEEKTFYDLFILEEKTKETEENLYKIVSTTIDEIAKHPKLSPRQLSAVEKFQIVVEMNESWQLNGSEDLRRDLAGILLAWKERIPFESSPLSFWSMLVRWRTHIFSNLWNSKTKEKTLQYRGYHETAHILNFFSKALRKHQAHPAALTNLESIYTLPNIEISDAYLKLEEHAKCYLEMEEYTAGLDLLGMTNLNYFTSAQKSGIFLLRGLLNEKKGLPEESAKIYAQAVQIHPTNAKVWYRWGVISLSTNPVNAVNAFLQAASISPGQIARKSIASIVALMDRHVNNEEMNKIFEMNAAEIDAWCFIPFIAQMVAILSRTGSPMCISALSIVARIYPQAVYFPIRNALESERKNGVDNTAISDLWTFLKTGFTLMCINIEGVVETLTLRLRCSAEEEFYRLLCALLSESLQQLFGKEPIDKGSLCMALKKISEMIGISSLSSRYKQSFDKDFLVFCEQTDSLCASTIWEMAQYLLKWKGALERILGAVPRRFSMENISRRLIDFDQRNEEIEMFGQYIEIADRAQQMVKIFRFESEIQIERRAGISLRKVFIRGNNGNLYRITLQMPSGKTVRREERFIQALALINSTFSRCIQMKATNAKIAIKKIISLNHQTKMVLEEDPTECLGQILEKTLGPQEMYQFIFKCRKSIQQSVETLNTQDALDPEKRLNMFIGATESISDSILFDLFIERFHSQNEFFYFRKYFAISHSMHCLFAYIFGIGSRMPSRMHIGTTTGAVYSSDFYPSFSDKPSLEEVPFRMTPNLQKLIGRTGLEGPFLSTMYYGATLLSKKTYLLNFMDALAREDALEEQAEKSMTISRSKINELILLKDGVPAKGIIRLVGNSTAPERLSMMDPQWHPWY
ncbi:transformation/transcription domain-associated protein [Nematocida sp. AWRm80]|nr:transformation/transcription domain-associated protein [Nematocida sp. AWRm80]